MIFTNRQILNDMIMGQDRHMFIYGYQNEERSKLLETMALESQKNFDGNSPIGIYISDIGLPNVQVKQANVDMTVLKLLARDYCSYLMCSEILKVVLSSKAPDDSDKFLKNINKMFLKREVSSLEEVCSLLEESKVICYDTFVNYSMYGVAHDYLSKIPFKFISSSYFISCLKRCINMKSYFALLFDTCDEMSTISQMAINDYVGCRNNADISIKVATSYENWRTYYCLNGCLIENVHDYGFVEIDDNLEKHIKRMKKRK